MTVTAPLRCGTLTVPLDHFDPANTSTIDVVFAILPASGAAKGAFVTATGGPGTSPMAARAEASCSGSVKRSADPESSRM